LIHKAKIKKAYAKIKAEELRSDSNSKAAQPEDEPQEEPQIHPDRQALLDGGDDGADGHTNAHADGEGASHNDGRPRGNRARGRRPDYFNKSLQHAERKKVEAEARAEEARRRTEQKTRRVAERERFRKAMGKARTGGKNGQRKLGRESALLLERVKRMVDQSK
jgi:hypothetical protein